MYAAEGVYRWKDHGGKWFRNLGEGGYGKTEDTWEDCQTSTTPYTGPYKEENLSWWYLIVPEEML